MSPHDDFYAIALKHLPIYIFAQDTNLRYTTLFAPHLPTQPDVQGKTDFDLCEKADAEHITHYKRRVLRTGHSQHLGIDMAVGKKQHIFDLTLEPLHDAEGNITGLTGAALDITTRKEAEDALQRSEARYHNLFSAISEGYGIFEIVTDTPDNTIDALILDVNPVLSKWLGRPPQELIGKTMRQFTPPMESNWLAMFGQMMSAGQPLHTQFYNAQDDQYIDIYAYHLQGRQFATLLLDITAQVRAQQALEDTNTRLSNTLESITDAYVAVDYQVRILQVNSVAARNLFHQPADQVIGRSLWELSGQVPGQSVYQSHLDRLQKGESVQYEYCSTDGRKWWEVHAYSHPDRLDLFMRDITSRKQADQQREQLLAQLERERAKLETLVNNAPEGITMADREGHVILSNPVAQQLYSRPIPAEQSYETLTSLQLRTSDGASIKPRNLPLTRSALDGETHANVEMSVLWPDGQHRDLLVNSAPIVDSHGDVSGAVSVFQDITERKATEQALQTALARTQELYDTSRSIGLAHTPADVLQVMVNTSYLKGCHYAIAGVFDRSWTNNDDPPETFHVIAVHSSEKELVNPQNQNYSLDRHWLSAAHIGQVPFCAEDISTEPTRGDMQWTLATALGARSLITLPLITGGACYGLMAFYYDHTSCLPPDDSRHVRGLADQAAVAIHNMRLLDAEAIARQEAERANELRLRFLAMISHELRTPLTSIKGFASTLLAEDISWNASSQHDFIQTIDQEADKLTDMIDQILDLSRLESGTLRIDPQMVAVNDIYVAARSLLNTLTQNHVLQIQIAEDLPAVRADRQRIAQVLWNLVSNAAKYSPEGSMIVVSARLVCPSVVFSITDQGMGILPADRPHLFEAFQRGSDIRARRIKGAGLGLAICKGLVEAHGGEIRVEKSDSSGTTISFTLPLA